MRYFRTRAGAWPAREFRRNLPSKLRSKLDYFASQVVANEGEIGGQIFEVCHAPFSNIFRVRVKLRQDLARYFCGIDGDKLILLDGIQKRLGEATPNAALSQAAACLAEYIETRNAD
jgi:hypothetical protein